MLLLFLLINLCEPITFKASADESLLSAIKFASHLLHGFRDYPLVVWTLGGEVFPVLSEILIKESQKGYHPVELWLESHARWREHLKFAPGKPFFVIFPPSLPKYSKNIMLNMLPSFTNCQYESGKSYFRQINDDIFLFVSDKYDGSQENPVAMQNTATNCVTPPQLLILKYKLEAVSKTWIQLESLYALRMRCYRANYGACMELVAKDGTSQILSWLSSHQVRNIIKVEWPKIEQSQAFIIGLSKSDIIDKYGWQWMQLKALFLGRRLRDLRSSLWTILWSVEFFELAAKVNITLTATYEYRHFERQIVGFIGIRAIGDGNFGISPSTFSLVGESHFKIMYRAHSSSYFNPLAAKSLSRAWRWLEVGIIIGLALIITAMLVQKSRPQDVFEIAMNMLAPLVCQGPPYKVTDRHKLVFYLWVVILWFLSTLYTSVLQSERVVPTTQHGNGTLKDNWDRKMVFFAGYRAYQTISIHFKGNRFIFYSTKNRDQLLKLADSLNKRDYYNLSPAESKNFFKLTTWGLLIESWEVKPLSKILTSFYQKDYEILGEKFYENFEWAIVQIPQLNYAAATYERLRENGIREYWNKATLMAQAVDIENAMRKRLNIEKRYWDDVVFEPMNTADSVFLEILTLCSLILSLSAIIFICRCTWIRVKEWGLSKLKKLLAFKEVVEDYIRGRNENINCTINYSM